jgi:hypothetical protein
MQGSGKTVCWALGDSVILNVECAATICFLLQNGVHNQLFLLAFALFFTSFLQMFLQMRLIAKDRQ